MRDDYVMIPTDFFEHEEVKYLENCDDGDSILVLWLEMLTKCKSESNGVRVFEWPYTEITYRDVAVFFDTNEELARKAFTEFEKLGIAQMLKHKILVRMFWEEKKQRVGSAETNAWRVKVLMRDGYECKVCGGKDDLQAHHIVAWKDTGEGDELRVDVSNGITLCRPCHLKAHGGSWKNSSTREMMDYLLSLIEGG